MAKIEITANQPKRPDKYNQAALCKVCDLACRLMAKNTGAGRR